jgi:hypothetical protein
MHMSSVDLHLRVPQNIFECDYLFKYVSATLNSSKVKMKMSHISFWIASNNSEKVKTMNFKVDNVTNMACLVQEVVYCSKLYHWTQSDLRQKGTVNLKKHVFNPDYLEIHFVC